MKSAPTLVLLLSGLGAVLPAAGQEGTPPPASCRISPPCAWVQGCFPRCGCCDDYCPRPYPPPCWPAYPSFYKCAPAGNCPPSTYGVPGKDHISCWFLPTPLTLREALWLRP
jgi:hypothetical protein